jgi:putative ABC transport system permease protein
MTRFLALAARNVARNRRRSAITLGAILFGVAAVVLLKGMVGGFVNLLVESVVEGKVGALQIHRKGYVGNLENLPLELNMAMSPELLEQVKAVPGVKAVAGRIQFTGLVSNGASQTMFVGRAIEPSRELAVCPQGGSDVAQGGAGLVDGDGALALLGFELAKSFRAVPTSFVTLSSSSPEGRANSVDVQVKGITTSGFAFENKRVMTVPLTLAQEILGMPGKVTELVVAVNDLKELEIVKARLEAALGSELEVHTWYQIQPFFKDVVNQQTVIFGLVCLILFVIVLTGILNTMLMSVFERVREIGTMLACGVRRRQVLTLFVLEALVLGILGGFLGGAFGRAVVAVIARQGLPFNMIGASKKALLRPAIEWPFIFESIAVAIVGVMLAAAYPAWKASRMNPVDALRSN